MEGERENRKRAKTDRKSQKEGVTEKSGNREREGRKDRLLPLWRKRQVVQPPPTHTHTHTTNLSSLPPSLSYKPRNNILLIYYCKEGINVRRGF